MALKANAAAAEFVPGSISLNVLGSSQTIPEFVPVNERIGDFSSDPQVQSASSESASFTLENTNDSALKTTIKFMPSHVDAPEFVPGSAPRPTGFDGLVGRAGEFRPSFQFGSSGLGNSSNLDVGSAAPARIPEFIPNSHTPYVQSDEFIGIAESSAISPSAQELEFGFEGTYESDPNQPGEGGVKKEIEFGENYGVHDKEGWAEIASAQLGQNSIDQDNSIVYATFDPVEELVWAGTASGRLCSHLVQYAAQDCR
jgi:hypothetical protein